MGEGIREVWEKELKHFDADKLGMMTVSDIWSMIYRIRESIKADGLNAGWVK